MPASDLGVGIVYWPEVDSLVNSRPDIVQVIEIETEAFWRRTDESEIYSTDAIVLERLNSFAQPKLVHGVGQPVGGSKDLDRAHLSMFRSMVDAHGALWASEHLSFNQADFMGGRFPTGFLLPPLPTHDGVTAAVANIRQAMDGLSVPFAFETGVNYLRPRTSELSDGGFVREVAAGADCNILLDLHNLWANEQNGRQPVREFVKEIPLDRVCEVHLAGGLELDGYWLDAHSGAIPEALLTIAEEVLPYLPNVRALIFEITPDFAPLFGLDRIVEQLELMHGIWRRRLSRCFAHGSDLPSDPPSNARLTSRVTPVADARLTTCAPNALPLTLDAARLAAGVWENTLGALILGEKTSGELANELAGDPAINIFRRLVRDQRAGAIVEHLRLTTRLIILHHGVAYLRSLLMQFWSDSSPHLFQADEVEAFSEFLLAALPDVPHLESVLRYEVAVLHSQLSGEVAIIPFSCDPLPLLQALAENRLPVDATAGVYELEVTPETSEES